MCLVMALVSPERALLLSDGFVMGGDRVLSRQASKIFTLSSGDKIVATGSDEGIKFVRSLQQRDPMPARHVAKIIRAWGEKHHQPNYFGLVGRNGGKLFVWRGRLSIDGWEDFIEEDFSAGSRPTLLIDGFFGVIRDERGEIDTPYRDEVRAEVRKILVQPTYPAMLACTLTLFEKIYRDWPERIGGQVFIDTLEPKAEREISFPFHAAFDSAAQKNGAVDSSGNLKLKNIAQSAGSTSSPTTSSGTYVVIPEMTKTLTTVGNNVIITFSGTFFGTGAASQVQGIGVLVALFKDGAQISPDYDVVFSTDASGIGTHPLIALTFLDSPSVASHTYDIRWKLAFGTTVGSKTTCRVLQIVELG